MKSPAEPVTYSVTVISGTGSGEYSAGESVTITANDPGTDRLFKEWSGVEDLTFTEGSAETPEATFTMPEEEVVVTATYEVIPKGVTDPAAKTGLVYNGSGQELVTAGTAESGIIWYASGTDAETAPESGAFSASIPEGKDAGT